jgi:hypothetical protein
MPKTGSSDVDDPDVVRVAHRRERYASGRHDDVVGLGKTFLLRVAGCDGGHLFIGADFIGADAVRAPKQREATGGGEVRQPATLSFRSPYKPRWHWR